MVYDALLQQHDRLHSEVDEHDISLDVSLNWHTGRLCADMFWPQRGDPVQAAWLLLLPGQRPALRHELE